MFSFGIAKGNDSFYSDLHVDFHCHLLPGVDDGSKSIAESIQLLKNAAELGFKKIVFTPHIRFGMFDNTREKLELCFKEFIRLKEVQSLGIELKLSAEYYLDHHFIALLEKGELMPISDDYLLVEFNMNIEPKNAEHFIYLIQTSGYIPILAHPERYSYWWKNTAALKKMRDKGVLMQLNINSINGLYGNGVSRAANNLIKQGLIDLLATDCHNLTQSELLSKTFSNRKIHKLNKFCNIQNSRIFS